MFTKRLFQSFVFFLCLINFHLSAQNFDPIHIDFEVDGELLQNPLIGGLIAPQFSSFDLDGQGAEDLIVFERSGNVILPFINNSTPGNPDYTYAPQYTPNFPEARNFLQFHDFNEDGKKDMFTLAFGVAGIEVYTNTSEGDEISFEILEINDATGFGNALLIPSGSNFSQVYVSNIDIPAIIDIDKDGDLDILSFEPDGGYMYYYQNMVKEMNLPADTFAYRLVDFCWGKFFESGVNEDISLSDDINECASGLLPGEILLDSRHAGSTVLALDGDGDNDFDLLIGDLTNNGLVYLENSPDANQALITATDTKFPINDVETDIFVFISPFYIDVDNDGKRDLIAAPNFPLGSQNDNHIWYYQNVGEDNDPTFVLQQKDFLLESTLIMGQGAAPTFLDYNGDGLKDLLVGNNRLIADQSEAITSLFLYENVGTKSEAIFKLVDSDYLDLRVVLGENNGYLTPTIGDLDSDGDDDLVIADKKGFLFYFENEAPADEPYSFKPYVYQYFDLKPGTICTPAIVDLEGDGLNDLLIGEKNNSTDPISGAFGSINYYRNYGSIGDPLFYSNLDTLDNTTTVGDVYTGSLTGGAGNAAPQAFLTDEGVKLAVGSKSGAIHIYDDMVGNADGQFNQVYDELPILYSGQKTTGTLADIDNDGFLEIIVGNDSGGLMAYNTIFKSGEGPTSTIEEVNRIKLYPNPTANILNIKMDKPSASPYNIYNVDGKLMMSGKLSGVTTSIETTNLSVGVYNISINGAFSRFVKI